MSADQLEAGQDLPLPSPHPTFGRRPSWFKRSFCSEDEGYWPTYRDAALYRQHMEECEFDRKVEAIGGHYADPYFDHRMKVKRYRDRLVEKANPTRPWWEGI